MAPLGAGWEPLSYTLIQEGQVMVIGTLKVATRKRARI